MKEMLSSKALWTAVIAVLVLLVSSLFPGFSIDQEKATALTIIAVTYILGVAVDPGCSYSWACILRSRKFWAAAIGLILVILGGFKVGLPAGLTEEYLVEIASVLGAYIGFAAMDGRQVGINPTR